MTHSSTPPRRFSTLPAYAGQPPIQRVCQLPPPAIQYLTAFTEAADGIALVRTLDESRGIIECWVMDDFKTDFDKLVEALAREWPIQMPGPEFD